MLVVQHGYLDSLAFALTLENQELEHRVQPQICRRQRIPKAIGGQAYNLHPHCESASSDPSCRSASGRGLFPPEPQTQTSGESLVSVSFRHHFESAIAV